jgi:hypothetical protein
MLEYHRVRCKAMQYPLRTYNGFEKNRKSLTEKMLAIGTRSAAEGPFQSDPNI